MKMTKKYILDNGILEQYVLGELKAEDAALVEQLIDQYSELKAQHDAIEASFERLALENAITPPDSVKQQLLDNIADEKTKVVHLPKRRNAKLFLGIAASIAAFCLLSSIWLYNELQSVKDELRIVGDSYEGLEKDFDDLNTKYSKTEKWYAALTNPNAEQYVLKGNALAPNAKIVSYVNHDNKSVIINAKQLPKLDDAHDYQMWADVDGEMIDMGVIEKGQDLLAMTYIDNAESLNITIEPAGGNDHPTVERLISNVYLE